MCSFFFFLLIPRPPRSTPTDTLFPLPPLCRSAAAVAAGSYPLAAIAMLTAVIAAFLYLRITVSMFLGDVDDADVPDRRTLPVPVGAGLALAICVAVTLGVGLFPHVLTGPAGDATAVLVGF